MHKTVYNKYSISRPGTKSKPGPEGGTNVGSFVMRRVKDGFVFQLYAPNRLILSTSPVYITEDACKKGILTVIEQGKNAGEADLTVSGQPLPKTPRYEILRDATGSYRFRLRAKKGDVILTSSAYSDATIAALGIGMVRENVEEARTYVWKNGEVVLMNLLRREKKNKKKPGRTPDVAELTIYTDRPLMSDDDKRTGGSADRSDAAGAGTNAAAGKDENDPISELFGK